MCGLTGREYIVDSANAWSHELSDCLLSAQQRWLAGNIKSIRTRLAKAFQIDKEEVMNRLFIPIVESSHFFVLVVDFNPSNPNFFSTLNSMIPCND